MTKKYREEDLEFQKEYEKYKKVQGEIKDRHREEVKRNEK